MSRRAALTIFSALSGMVFITAASLSAQEGQKSDLLTGLRNQAVVLDIVTRIVEQDLSVFEDSISSKATIPGQPVAVKLVGENIVVVAQFTPYLWRRQNGGNGSNHVLVAQGQVWLQVPDEGISYQTSIQTIPLDFGEQVYFFPLGSSNDTGHARIEIELELRPYMEEETPGDSEGAETVPEEQPDTQ